MKLGGYAFHEMKRYLTNIESDLRARSIRSKLYCDEQRNTYPEWAQFIDEEAEKDLRKLNERFTRILYGSCLVTSFAIFEWMIKKVCILAARKYSHKLPPRVVPFERLITAGLI